MEKVTVQDGKYSVIIGDDGTMSFERNGEPWAAANAKFAHVGLIYALAAELAAAKETLSTFKSMEVIAIKHADETIRDGLLKMLDREIQEAERQVAHHLVLGTMQSSRDMVKAFMDALITGEVKQ